MGVSKKSPESYRVSFWEYAFFCEEASGIPDIMFQVAEGSLSAKGAKVVGW